MKPRKPYKNLVTVVNLRIHIQGVHLYNFTLIYKCHPFFVRFSNICRSLPKMDPDLLETVICQTCFESYLISCKQPLEGCLGGLSGSLSYTVFCVESESGVDINQNPEPDAKNNEPMEVGQFDCLSVCLSVCQ